MKKKIPTLIGLGILVVGLIVGIVFLGTGPGIFAPRATAETTPERIKLTNVTDNSFTVSFLTPGATSAFVKYGTGPRSIKSQIGDDRDQLSGTIGEYQLHHITVRGLKSATNYYYTLGTGSNGSFDNNGSPFTVKTAQKSGVPPAAKTIYGLILNKAGSSATGSVVYATIPGVGEISALVKSSGRWAMSLSNARKADGSGYAQISNTDQISFFVQGVKGTLEAKIATTIEDSQPLETITLGGGSSQSTDRKDISQDSNQGVDNTAEEKDLTSQLAPDTSDNSADLSSSDQLKDDGASLGDLVSNKTESSGTIINFEASESGQVVTTGDPTIVGVGAPNTTIQLEINSDSKIVRELTADANGNFELDLGQLKQTLEPGEHTATYTYTDPTTGELVTKTITFTVEDSQLALAEPAGTSPYGSGNPYSIDNATESAAASPSATPLATRSALPASNSALPVSGSVGTTMALVLGGLFFIVAGGWSYYLATQIEVAEVTKG